jgi:hypothetical protein
MTRDPEAGRRYWYSSLISSVPPGKYRDNKGKKVKLSLGLIN